jgi:hypothetical protein
VTIEELGVVAGREQVTISRVVSTSYQEGARWCPEVLKGARAVLPLIDSTVRAREERERTLRLAGTLAFTGVTLRGARPDAETAAPKILDFLADALDRRTVDPVRARYARASRRLGRACHPPVDAPFVPREIGRVRDRVCSAASLRVSDFLGPAQHRRVVEYVLAREADFTPSQLIGLDGTVRVDSGSGGRGRFMASGECGNSSNHGCGPCSRAVCRELGFPSRTLVRSGER